MGWAEVTEDRIICHQGTLPQCGICGTSITPKGDPHRAIGGVPLCFVCSAQAEDDAEFNAWATRQIDRAARR